MSFGREAGTLTTMFKAAIISKPQKPELAAILRDLIAWLEEHNYEPLLDHQSAAYVDASNAIERCDLHQHQPNLVIVLGGDGTLLAAARAFALPPVLAITALPALAE